MSLEFEWDPDNAEENLKKHGVGFDEALTVFADPSARIFAALSGRTMIVTHNVRHFARASGLIPTVLSPAEFLKAVEDGP